MFGDEALAKLTRALLLIALLEVIFVLSFDYMPLVCSDIFWHVKAGQEILARKSLHFVDEYSCTCTGMPWRHFEWLSEIVFYLAYAWRGLGGLQVVKTALLMGSYLLLYRSNYEMSRNDFVSVAISLFACLGASSYSGIRPHFFTLLFFPLLILISSRFERSSPPMKWVLVYPLLMMIWMNFHGGCFIGIAYLSLMAVSRLYRKDVAGAKFFCVSALLSVLATFINPYTHYAALFPLYWMKNNVYVQTITEFRPMARDFQNPDFVYYVEYCALFVLGVAVRSRAERKIDLADLVFFLPFAYLPLKSMRHLGLFYIALAGIISRNLSRFPEIVSGFKSTYRQRLTAAVVILFVATAHLIGFVKANYPFEQFQSRETFPDGAIAYMIANKVHGNVFNDYGWGGYLVWRVGPDIKVFIDGRQITLYPEEIYIQYLKIAFLRPGWQAKLDHYHVGYILLNKEFRNELPMFSYLAKCQEWHLVYEDGISVLYARTAPPGAN